MHNIGFAKKDKKADFVWKMHDTGNIIFTSRI
jgi:uncharacterized protein YegP (UPF0339 family)